jgi:hypothetical protein
MRMTGGDIADHDAEVDEVAFVPLADAIKLATYKTDAGTLRTVAGLVSSS